jgi:hypothetical protein
MHTVKQKQRQAEAMARMRVHLGVEQRCAGNHLVDHDAKRPEVHLAAIRHAFDNFGSQVARCAAEGPTSVSDAKSYYY